MLYGSDGWMSKCNSTDLIFLCSQLLVIPFNIVVTFLYLHFYTGMGPNLTRFIGAYKRTFGNLETGLNGENISSKINETVFLSVDVHSKFEIVRRGEVLFYTLYWFSVLPYAGYVWFLAKDDYALHLSLVIIACHSLSFICAYLPVKSGM